MSLTEAFLLKEATNLIIMRKDISQTITAIKIPLSKTNSRNYGIDLLKITAMFFIVCVHLGGHGKAFPETWFGILQHSIFAVGVNCFALTSGYILIDRKYKLHRILVYWLQVVFYSSLIMVYFYISYPGSVSKREILFFLRPLYTDRYWYFSAYCIMYLFIPVYNALLNSLSKKQTYTFTAVLILIFSVLNLGLSEKYFALSGGFSMWWLSILYFIGAVIGKYMNTDKYKVIMLLTAFLLSVMLTTAFNMSRYRQIIRSFLKVGNFHYNSITILLSSVILMMLFTKVTVKNTVLQKCITKISTLTFGVYLIHDNHHIRTQFILDRFAWLSKLSPVTNVLQLIGIGLVIFVTCLMIDYVRAFLFDVFNVNFLCEKLCGFFIRKIRLLSDKWLES